MLAFGSFGKIGLWNTETGINLDIPLLDQNEGHKPMIITMEMVLW